MPWDINDPYRAILGDDDDPEAVGIFGPRKLDQYTAEERAQKAMAVQAAHRAKVKEQQQEAEQEGVYRAPFPPLEDELPTDYAERLAIAATEEDRGKWSKCLHCKEQFKIGVGCRGPVLCSDRCLTRSRKADKNRARDIRRGRKR